MMKRVIKMMNRLNYSFAVFKSSDMGIKIKTIFWDIPIGFMSSKPVWWGIQIVTYLILVTSEISGLIKSRQIVTQFNLFMYWCQRGWFRKMLPTEVKNIIMNSPNYINDIQAIINHGYSLYFNSLLYLILAIGFLTYSELTIRIHNGKIRRVMENFVENEIDDPNLDAPDVWLAYENEYYKYSLTDRIFAFGVYLYPLQSILSRFFYLYNKIDLFNTLAPESTFYYLLNIVGPILQSYSGLYKFIHPILLAIIYDRLLWVWVIRNRKNVKYHIRYHAVHALFLDMTYNAIDPFINWFIKYQGDLFPNWLLEKFRVIQFSSLLLIYGPLLVCALLCIECRVPILHRAGRIHGTITKRRWEEGFQWWKPNRKHTILIGKGINNPERTYTFKWRDNIFPLELATILGLIMLYNYVSLQTDMGLVEYAHFGQTLSNYIFLN